MRVVSDVLKTEADSHEQKIYVYRAIRCNYTYLVYTNLEKYQLSIMLMPKYLADSLLEYIFAIRKSYFYRKKTGRTEISFHLLNIATTIVDTLDIL